MANCEFSKNHAPSGGGIYASDSDLIIDSCSFSENEARDGDGGAIRYYADIAPNATDTYKILITNSTFAENTATNYCGGAFIEEYDVGSSARNVIIDDCEFSNNMALAAGGLGILGNSSNVELSNSFFLGNEATEAGAGFVLGTNSIGDVYNCVFVANEIAAGGTSSISGGGAVWDGARVDFMNCTFADNSAQDGAGLYVIGGTASLINCIFWGNRGDQLAISANNDIGGELAAVYCNVQGGRDSIRVIDTLSHFTWGSGNMAENPLFKDLANRDCHLETLSPCIGAGIDSIEINGVWHFAPPYDIEGNPRPAPDSSKPDMGAYESKYVQRVNLIANPGFESGIEPWKFYTSGSGSLYDNAPGDGSAHAAHVEIISADTNVQLYQPGLAPEAGMRYRLSFKAYSNRGHDLEVYLHQHGKPYTAYGLDGWGFYLGTSWDTHMVEFNTEGFTGAVQDGRLRFWLAPYAEAGDHYYFDDVVLERLGPALPSTNVVRNPSFEFGTYPWRFYADVEGGATFSDDGAGVQGNSSAHVAVASEGTNVQLYQEGITLEPQTRYRLVFQAYSNTGHDLGVYIHKHEKPHTDYGLECSAKLGTSWQPHTVEFTTKGFNQRVMDGRLRFWFAPYARSGDHYYVDGVVLQKLGPEIVSGTLEKKVDIPTEYALSQNYPNPFNPSTTIEYALPHAGFVTLKVYNVLGEEVASLIAGDHAAGTFKTTWDASNMPSGVYFYRLTAGEYVQTKKMILMR
jgi:predicted outer membrane repeat protein